MFRELILVLWDVENESFSTTRSKGGHGFSDISVHVLQKWRVQEYFTTVNTGLTFKNKGRTE